jgi:hypothetical protein
VLDLENSLVKFRCTHIKEYYCRQDYTTLLTLKPNKLAPVRREPLQKKKRGRLRKDAVRLSLPLIHEPELDLLRRKRGRLRKDAVRLLSLLDATALGEPSVRRSS